ncbi:hypothetical protein AQUCO_02200324v1 [Aquilegia coerulea]|uniref:RNase H type-1 domain-containing protein n=1 Tax=Aquilegia coerulea TaxID=218851 RepID=A0A2G5DE50_AQUCA|nr:hypothetical protein AQUCO_02200324v1 [Aquilegia coerulea]
MKECKWYLLDVSVVKINCDGASRSNPGQSGLGCIFRNWQSNFLLVIAKGIGLGTNFEAECGAVIEGVEEAVKRGWLKIWIESDSTTAIQAFAKSKKLQFCLLSHTWREVNYSANQAANKGVGLSAGDDIIFAGRPPWIVRWENAFQAFERL